MDFTRKTYLIIGLGVLLGIVIIIITSRTAAVYYLVAIFPLLLFIIIYYQAKRHRPKLTGSPFSIPVMITVIVIIGSMFVVIFHFSPTRVEARLERIRRTLLPSQVLVLEQPYPLPGNTKQADQIAKLPGLIQQSERLGFTAHPELHLEAGLLYFSVKDNSSAQAEFSKAVQTASQSDSSKATLAIAYNDLGVALGKQNKGDESLQAFNSALENASDRKTILVAELNKARAYRTKGQYQEASNIADNTLKQTDLDDYLRATALRVKGLVAEDQSRLFDEQGALSYYSQAAVLYQKGGNVQELAITYNNIGNVYISKRDKNDADIAKAISNHEAALTINRQIEKEEGIADSYASLAYDYLVRNELDKATQYAEQAKDIFAKKEAKVKLAAVLDTIGQIYEKESDIDKAVSFFQQSLEVARRVGNKRGQAETLKNLGTLYAHQADCERAMPLLLEAAYILQEIGSKDEAGNVEAVYADCACKVAKKPRPPSSR